MQVYGVGINFLDETQPLQTMPSWVRKCLGSALGDEFTELLVTEYHVEDAHPPHIDRTMWGPKIVGLSLLSAVRFHCHELQRCLANRFLMRVLVVLVTDAGVASRWMATERSISISANAGYDGAIQPLDWRGGSSAASAPTVDVHAG